MADKKETAKKIKTAENPLALLDLSTISQKIVTTRTFSLWVRALLQNWRQGTVGCKGRSDVARSRKKPWKQKGTGRARVGSARSPLWRGGGIIFGPQPRTRTLKIPAQMKQRVLMHLMRVMQEEGRLRVLDFTIDTRPKTAAAFQALKQAGLTQRTTVLVAPEDALIHASFANIANTQLLFFDQLNAYHLAHCEHVVVLQKDVERFNNMVSQWI